MANVRKDAHWLLCGQPKTFHHPVLERCCVEEGTLWMPSTGVNVICFTKCLAPDKKTEHCYCC